ncbi:MAG TPA: hypothetical protein DDZ80_12570 [Cyanobacteria bacterium UBA8803]|nr:hypothetical protein [Cyanobacteria bacterium UBA9273]HBL59312.1 hypothetical protein [Cyanobacteria bacterium UBA8803]
MEPNPQKSDYTESTSPEPVATPAKNLKDAQVDVNIDQPGAIAQFSSTSRSTDQPWQELAQPVFEFLSKLPGIISGFYYEYQQGIIIFGLVVTGFIGVYITLAVLDAINDIPLLAPLFELVGIAYTAWFIARYLWKAESRKELAHEFNSLKGQLFGRDSLDS